MRVCIIHMLKWDLVSPEVNLDARRKLAPSATSQVEGRISDLYQVVRVVTRVDEEAHLGHDVRHVWMVTVPADVDHPLVRCEIFSLVASDPLRNVAHYEAPLHLVMDSPVKEFDREILEFLRKERVISPRIGCPIWVFVKRGKIARYDGGCCGHHSRFRLHLSFQLTGRHR